MTQEFPSSFRLLLQTTKLLVDTVFPLLPLTCGRCVLFFDVVEKKLFSVHTVSEMSVLLFKDGLDMRMENFSCRHSLHISSPGAYGFTFFIISHLMLKSVFFFFNFQMWSLRVVVVVLCSSLNDDLCRLNLVINSFSVSPTYVSCFFVSVSVTVAL